MDIGVDRAGLIVIPVTGSSARASSRVAWSDTAPQGIRGSGRLVHQAGPDAGHAAGHPPLDDCNALYDLLDHVSPISAGEIERVIREETGRSPEQVFDRFEPVPLASGSI